VLQFFAAMLRLTETVLKLIFSLSVHAAGGIFLLLFCRRQVMYSLVNEYPFTNSGSTDTIFLGKLSEATALC
jgi:hypothetical protein